ncbi:MAG: hypothetical protein ABSB70_00170 [Candidatus Velthaea sp.]
MMPRIERHSAPLRRVALTRRRRILTSLEDRRDPELALAYSNGFVTVEISQAALDAFIELTGDVPLPVVCDPQTGDRRAYDPQNKVRVVYDAAANLREISTRGRDGIYVRINFTGDGTRVA